MVCRQIVSTRVQWASITRAKLRNMSLRKVCLDFLTISIPNKKKSRNIHTNTHTPTHPYRNLAH